MLHLVLTLLALLPGQDAPPDEAAPAAASEPATMLRLYEGAILWGQIEQHDSEGLLFLRLDNGGRVRLPWTRLDPAQAEGLLETFGYIDHSEDELMIEADRLVLDDGTEWIGRITSRSDKEIYLKTASALVPIPKIRLRGAATVVQVPALDVYTGEQLYQQELARIAPADAAAHFELARFAERVLEYERAVEHYKAARELDPAYKSAELPNYLARATERAASKSQIDYLREIDNLRGRGRYDQALKMAAAFAEVFEGSSLIDDAMRRHVQVEKGREKALRARTQRAWFDWSGRLAAAKARDIKLTLEGTLGWIEESMGEEVLAAVHKELMRTVSAEVTPEQVRRYWNERQGVRVHRASYGEGTWLLGKEGAERGLPAAPAEDESKLSETDRARKQLEDRLKRFMENQAIAGRKAKAEGDEESEQAKFWSEWSAAERAQWILASYVENAGDMQLVRIEVRNCPECSGKGHREIVNVNAAPARPDEAGKGSGQETVPCPLCHTVARVRRVVYK
jgi:hypothetical protein